MVSITFLGTGGGRFATIYQTRSTGGMLIEDRGRIHLDPGPGALTNMARLNMDPGFTDAVLISHCHPDHYSDAEVLIEGMTRGGINTRGLLAGSVSTIDGIDGIRPAISDYHRQLPSRVLSVRAGDEADIAGMRTRFTPTRHTDASGVGAVFETSAGTVSYMGDTDPREEVTASHEGCRVLILNVTRPFGARLRCHLCSEDVPAIVERLRPELTVLTHMGVKMVEQGPEEQALRLERMTGSRIVAARDMMRLDIGDSLRVNAPTLL